MAASSSLESRLAVVCLVIGSAACSVGAGSGEFSAAVFAPECDRQGELETLRPDFFAATPIRKMMHIRIQHGSDIERVSDGLSIAVDDVDDIRQNRLGQPIDLTYVLDITGSPRPPATVTFYFNQTCKVDREENQVVYLSRAGTLVFRSIYAPDIDKQDREISGSLIDVEVTDTSSPETRRAVLNGEFRFLFVRGRPAQPFPSR